MSKTKKAGVMGWPIEHSLSPRLHSYWLNEYEIDGSYERLPVAPEKLKDALHDLSSQGFCGVNLTVPHKEAALKIIDRTNQPITAHIGAVNTILVETDGTLTGVNTDLFGFTQNLLTHDVVVEDKIVTIIGAGGAARAAAVALYDMEAKEIRIMNRTLERASALAEQLNAFFDLFVPAPFHRKKPLIKVFSFDDGTALEGAGLLVNATSLGLKGQPPLDIALDPLPKSAVVTDMVYVPLMTDLLVRADERGHKVIDGLGMLLYQAVPVFELFFGVEPKVTTALRTHVLAKS